MKKIIILLFIWIGGYASSFVQVESKYNAEVTVKKITTLIEAKKGFSVFTIIDHQENAKKVGMKLPFEQVIIFGNPKAGTKLIQVDALMGYELPMRIMVYEKGNKVMVVYKKPDILAETYMIKGSPILPKMKKVMFYFTSSIEKK